MGTIEMSQVAGFKAVDAEGNELGVVSMSELTASISEQVMQTIAMRNQANTLEQPGLMSAASTLAAGNDAFENELPEQTDLKWARALDASGNPILISKESLASVVGGLLGNPLGFAKNLTSEDDCNNLKDGRYSYVYPNAPLNAYDTNGTIIQITTYGRSDVWQFAMSFNASGVAVRIKSPSGWSGWNKFASIIV